MNKLFFFILIPFCLTFSLKAEYVEQELPIEQMLPIGAKTPSFRDHSMPDISENPFLKKNVGELPVNYDEFSTLIQKSLREKINGISYTPLIKQSSVIYNLKRYVEGEALELEILNIHTDELSPIRLVVHSIKPHSVSFQMDNDFIEVSLEDQNAYFKDHIGTGLIVQESGWILVPLEKKPESLNAIAYIGTLPYHAHLVRYSESLKLALYKIYTEYNQVFPATTVSNQPPASGETLKAFQGSAYPILKYVYTHTDETAVLLPEESFNFGTIFINDKSRISCIHTDELISNDLINQFLKDMPSPNAPTSLPQYTFVSLFYEA